MSENRAYVSDHDEKTSQYSEVAETAFSEPRDSYQNAHLPPKYPTETAMEEVILSVKIEEGKKMRALLAGLFMCLGSVSMGAVIGWPSPATPNLNSNPNPFHLDDDQNSWIGSIITLGGLFGGLVAGPVMDWIGRQMAVMFCLPVFMVGWVVIEASPNFGCMLAGRLITGLCSGMVLVTVPAYLGEVAPVSIRGLLGSCHQLGVTIGILIAYIFGYFLPWNWLAFVCSVLPACMMVAMSFMPETPRWLLSKGRREEAKVSLLWLRGDAIDLEPELRLTEQTIAMAAKEGQVTWREFKKPELWKPLLISLGLMVFQQFSGTNVVMFYTVQIFQLAGSSLDANLQTIIVGIVGVVGTLVSVFVADKVGRVVLLVISAVIMGISMAGMGAFFYEQHITDDISSLAWLPVTCLVLYNFGFNVAFGPIPWVMMGELFPLRAKGPASGFCAASNWLFAFILTKFWNNITGAIGIYGGYWLMCGFCVLAIPFTLLFVPETKDYTLEQIQENFKKRGRCC